MWEDQRIELYRNMVFAQSENWQEQIRSFLERQLGKMGLVIYSFANGWDDSPVSAEGYQAPIKSIGNSTTTPRDLENDQDVQIISDGIGRKCCSQTAETWFKYNVVSISIVIMDYFHFLQAEKAAGADRHYR